MALTIGVPREVQPGERRVATVPEVVEKLVKQGFRIAVEAGAGEAAQIGDDAYRAAGAEVVADRTALWAMADIVFKVRAPDAAEVGLLREGGTLVTGGSKSFAPSRSAARPRNFMLSGATSPTSPKLSITPPRSPSSLLRSRGGG